MEPKKNPKADLSRKSILFFQIGMILMLFITWQAIEWKTYDREAIDTGMVSMDDFEEEDVPITELQNTPPPPPPPPPAPEVIEIVEDEEEVEETIIESTETTQEEIVEVEEVQEVEEEEEIGDVPFTVIEDVPVFPGCEQFNTNQERKDCMSEKITEHVNDNFDTGLGMELGLSGITTIYVGFKIEKTGDVSVLFVRAPHPKLKAEAERVVRRLPKMQPGMQRGQKVGVTYQLPIRFQIRD